MIFSPNMLKTFDDCPYKFFLKYIEKISMPQSAKPFEKGKNVHTIANYFLKGENIEKFENILTKDELISWKSLKNNKYFNLQNLKTEYELSLKINAETVIGGRIDAIFKDAENIYILDYKTGAIPKNPENDFQTIVYLLCVCEKFQTHNLKFIYIDLKNNQNIEIDFDENIKQKYLEKIKATCEKIEICIKTEDFKQAPNKAFCEFKKYCNNCK